MKLHEFLSLIQDEEARIELELGWIEDNGEEYQYHHFWLSDFRTDDDIAKYYRHYNVSSFSFMPEEDSYADMMIHIKP